MKKVISGIQPDKTTTQMWAHHTFLQRFLFLLLLLLGGVVNGVLAQTTWYKMADEIDFTGATGYWIRNAVSDRMNLSTRQPDTDDKGQAGWRTTKGRIYTADFTDDSQVFYFKKDGSGRIFMYTQNGSGRTYLAAASNDRDMGIETRTDDVLPDGSKGYVKSIENIANTNHVRFVISKNASGATTDDGYMVAYRGFEEGCFVYLDGKVAYNTLCQWIVIPYKPKEYLESEISVSQTLHDNATVGTAYNQIKDASYKTALQSAIDAANTAKNGTTAQIQTAWENLLTAKETFLNTAYNEPSTGKRYYIKNANGEYLHRNGNNNPATAISTYSNETERVTLTKVDDDFFVSVDGRYLAMNRNMYAEDGNKRLALVTPQFVSTAYPPSGKLRLRHIDNNHIGLYFSSNGVGTSVNNGINMSNRTFIHYHDGRGTAPFDLRADRMNGLDNVEQFEPSIRWTLEEVADADQYYTYHLINRSGVEVVSYTVAPTSTGALSLDSRLQSPYATNFRFFSTVAAATANTDGVAEKVTTYADVNAKDNGRHIYVGYDVGPGDGSVHFDGTTTYSFCCGPNTEAETYLQFSSVSENARPNAAYTGYDNQLWTLDGGTHQDPYDIELRNVAYPGYHLSSAWNNNGQPVNGNNAGHTGTQNKLYNTATEVQKFAYLNNGDGTPTLICFARHADTDKVYVLFWGSTQWFNIYGSNSALPITLESDLDFIKSAAPITLTYRERLIHVTYKIVSITYGDTGGGHVVYSTTQQDVAGASLNLPDWLRSPLATNYKYYTEDQFTVTDGRYVLNGNAVESTVYPSTDNTTVYVKYEYDPDNSITFGSNTLQVDLTGQTRYTINTSTESSKRYLGFTNSRQTFESSNDSYYVHRDNTSDPAVAWNDYYLWTLGSATGGVPDPYCITIRSAMPVARTFFLAPQSNANGSGSSTWNGSGSTSWLIPDAAVGTCVRTWALLTGNKLVSNLVPGTDTKVVRFSNTAWTYQDELSNISSEADILLNAATVGYHVVNKSGDIAVSTRVPRLMTGDLSIPADLKSAHIIDDGLHYRYFATQAEAATYTAAATDEDRTAAAETALTTYDALAALPSTEVYVGYYYDATNCPAGVPALGTTVASATRYHVQINDKYWKASDKDWHNRPNFGDGGNELPSANYQWIFFSENSDPYDIRIKSPYWPDGYLHDQLDYLESGGTAGAYSTSHGMYLNRVTGSNSHGHDEVHSFFFTQSDIGLVIGVATPPNKAGRQSYLYNHNNSYALLQRNTRGGDARQKVVLTQLYLYHVVNKAGNKAVSAYMPATSPLTVPTGLRTPLMTNSQYRFFTTQEKAAAYNANPTDEVATAQGAITTAPSTQNEIYLGYNYVNNPEVMDLKGERWYNIKGISSPNSADPIYYYRQDENSSWTGVRTRAAAANTLYFMWSFSGLDPYDIHITNGKDNKKLKHDTSNYWDNQLTVNDDTYSTFMLLEHEDGYATLAVHNQWYVNKNFNLGSAGDDAYIGMKFYLAYWGSHNGIVKVMCNDSYFHYYSDRNRYGAYATKLQFELVKYVSTFHIIDNSGREAIKYTGEIPANMPLNFDNTPAAIRSPYLVDETMTFYNTATANGEVHAGQTKYDLSDKMTQTPATTGTDIYVRYTTNHLSEKPFRLTGARSFNVRIGGQNYIYTSGEEIHTTTNDANKTLNTHYWNLFGGDPYAVKIHNVANNKWIQYASTTNDENDLTFRTDTMANCYFIAMRTTNNGYELMAATGTDAGTDHYFSIGHDQTNSTVKLYRDDVYPHAATPLQMILSTNDLRALYHIIDKQNKVIITAEEENVELQVPASIRSPFVSKYYYYDKNSFNVTGSGSSATYVLKDVVDTLKTIAEATTEADVYQIYVTYDVSDAVKMYTSTQTKDSDRTFYRLKYHGGASFRQEDGHDNVESTSTKAIYPYSNGDANFYVYGENQLNTQMGAAASTRNRWTWYFESEHNDPYHVKICSASSTFYNLQYDNGTVVGDTIKKLRVYFRTYQPKGYGHIVTGAITKHTCVTSAPAGVGDATAVPTEYMVLGTSLSQCRLMTVDDVALDLNEDGDTNDPGESNERRTVTSFEQYWKNNPTVKGEAGVKEPAADNAKLAALGWHRYKAWAHCDPWDSKGKTYKYEDHWFQTITMGETFEIEEMTIDPVLILLDQHGWEIMRKPIPSKYTVPQAEKDAKYAAIRPYDSPMVKAYHFWHTGKKMDGYHKYKVSEHITVGGKEYTSTSLTQLPPYTESLRADNILDTKGNVMDQYVTYEVKEEYAASYTGAATEGAVKKGDFLVRQGQNYAQTTDGNTLSTTTAPATAIANNDVNSITDEMLWYIAPNFNIDGEMGYHYEGYYQEKTKDETEADYFNGVTPAWTNGFDPYNLRIQSKKYPTKYLTTNATGAGLDATASMASTYSGAMTVSLTDASAITDGKGHDNVTLKMSNTTFMAVQDANGNMRLMPRFDHSHVVTNFTMLDAQHSAAPANDGENAQTTILLRPLAYTYIIVDNEGHESLRYKGKLGEVSPSIPTHFQSPLAKDFRFYKDLAKVVEAGDDTTYTEIPAGTDLSAKLIGTTFAAAEVTGKNNIVYVRYSFNPEGDQYKLLSEGDWHTIDINYNHVKVDWDANPSRMVIETAPGMDDPNRKYWECKFIGNATTEVPDPYNVSGFNRARPTDRWAYHFALLAHGDSLALAVAGRVVAGLKDSPEKYVFLSTHKPESTIEIAFLEELGFGADGTYDGTRSQVVFGEGAPTNVKYIVITNEGKQALIAKEPASRAKGEPTRPTAILPPWARSPLLNVEDFSYYMHATYNESTDTYSLADADRTTLLLGLPSDTVYVRYHYNVETCPFTVKDTYFTSEMAPTYTPLDLTGSTWYNMVSYSWGDNWFYAYIDKNGVYKVSHIDRPAQYSQFTRYPKHDGNFDFQGTKPYMWKMTGSDPYAIKIQPALNNDLWLAAAEATEGENQSLILSNDPDDAVQTFMILKPKGNAIRIVATNKLPFYLHNPRWDQTWLHWHSNIDESLENPYQNADGHDYEFFKAPTVRYYTFHGIRFNETGTEPYAYENGKPKVTWTATLRRNWLMPVKMEEDLQRLFTRYEKENTSNVFVDYSDVGDGRFYSNQEMTEKVHDDNSDQDDVYPEIDNGDTYHIYFKYKPLTNAEIAASESYSTLPFQYSTPEQVAADVAYHQEKGQLNGATMQTKWFFMVLDTDEGITRTIDGEGHKHYVGNQYFLRRENDGSVCWMDNTFAFHKEREDNYNNYTYSRMAEWYQKGENDAFREGRWLWAFVGDDPYNTKLLNFESATGVSAKGVGIYTLEAADNCYTVMSEVTDDKTGTKTYPVSVPTEEPTEHDSWGLCTGYGTEKTMSLVSTAFTRSVESFGTTGLPYTIDVTQELYWQMVTHTTEETTTKGVEGVTKSLEDRSNAIQLLPYIPVNYQDIELVIRRDDEVNDYLAAAEGDKPTKLANMKTGLHRLIFAAEDRRYAEGDKITEDILALEVKRAYCDYTFYSNYKMVESTKVKTTPFENAGDGIYEVQEGPFRGDVQMEEYIENGQTKQKMKLDDNKQPLYNYYTTVEKAEAAKLAQKNNDAAALAALASDLASPNTSQRAYIKYKVTSDLFLKTEPTKAEVTDMLKNNDHLYFMDFTMNKDEKGYDKGHHAYYAPYTTFEIYRSEMGNKTEKLKWDGSNFVDDDTQRYNFCNFKTTSNRMESVPEDLKWYFVGDPYKLQVFMAKPEFFNTEDLKDETGATKAAINTKNANLARFDETESNFRFVIDCVHLRLPDYTVKDTRQMVDFYLDERGLNTEPVQNPEYGEYYYGDFYWEMVPAASTEEGTFALRFKANNELMGYRDVYYYLVHDGTKKKYYATDEAKTDQPFPINLQYFPDNEKQLTGDYPEYHRANGDNAVIRLVEPAKVYVSAYKDDGDHTFKAINKQTTDELSEYFGVGEPLNDVPRHLKRKYVKYNDNIRYTTSKTENTVIKPDDKTSTDQFSTFTLTEEKAYKLQACTEHPLGIDGGPYTDVFKDGSQTKAEFKIDVLYELDDLNTPKEGGTPVHLFTSPSVLTSLNDPNYNLNADATWLDLSVNGSTWVFYDKTSDKGVDYTSAFTPKDNGYNGWTTGLKGLHWAFIGDPYNFIAINRRQYDDKTYSTTYPLLVATKDGDGHPASDLTTTFNKNGVNYTRILASTSDTVWYTQLKGLSEINLTPESSEYAHETTTSQLTQWSFIYAKTGGEDDAFIRTASLKETTNDPINNQTANETNHYWQLTHYAYPDSKDPSKSQYITIPFSLSTPTDSIQKTKICTAVIEDEDAGQNNCFDANIRVYDQYGNLKAYKDKAEVRYGDAVVNMPTTLKRYGCSYTCYINYDPATGTGTQVTNLLPTTLPSITTFGGYKDYTIGNEAEANKPNNGYPIITYVYTVDSDMEPFFTTEDEAKEDQMTWTNAYFKWDQSIQGGKITVYKYELDIVGYLYDAEGKVQDVIKDWVGKAVESGGGSQVYTTYGWLNSHDDGEQAYGNDPNQTEDNYQKWAFIGDPYDFQLKNYEKYLQDENLSLFSDEEANINFSNTEASSWALAVAKDGTPYLAIIDEDGNILKYITFERLKGGNTLKDNEQFIYQAGDPHTSDPTGNFYNVNNVKPFYLKDLMAYAQQVIYHLVIAHQHSSDYTNTDEQLGATTVAQALNKKLIRRHMAEYLHYHGDTDLNGTGDYDEYLQFKADEDYNYDDYQNYIAWDFKDGHIDGDGKADLTTITNDDDRAAIKALMKKASLRDLVSYPVKNLKVNRVGIGNMLDVPWYMRRQFCNYKLYQRDVLRSEMTDVQAKNSEGKYIWQNLSTGETEYTTDQVSPGEGFTEVWEVTWQSVTKEKTGGGYAEDKDAVEAANGKIITKLDNTHKNRIVLIDVVYEVNPKQFRFTEMGRNTTNWYQMMTCNENADGLMNFSYKDGVGARPDKEAHYTNNYLWAPVGDPYGFTLHNRYATLNGSGWDNVVVTTTAALPTEGTTTTPESDNATYTKKKNYQQRKIVQYKYGEGDVGATDEEKNTAGATNAVYEMFRGNTLYSNAFLMHPTSAYINTTGDAFGSHYMVHKTAEHKAQLQYNANAATVRNGNGWQDANWRLVATPEQLLPYFDRAGYVGGLKPNVADNHVNREYYSKLNAYKADPTTTDFEVLDHIREVVYAGKFLKKGGAELPAEEDRPTADADLPLRFVSNNLVPMAQGYYRIEALSRRQLDKDGTDISGITGPRFISGYRFLSERDYAGYDGSTLQAGSRHLHFIETDEQHSTFKTFGQLNEYVAGLSEGDSKTRRLTPHPAMRGNIEILPAEYDPSSIFYFEPTGTAGYSQYRLGTQGLYVNGVAGSGDAGTTKMVTAVGSATPFRMDDIGGTAFTFRTLDVIPGNWDTDADHNVTKNIQTNYLSIDAAHRYRITVHTDNELEETGDYYEGHQWSDDGKSYGIQDTKWLLKPVGIPGDWPYNNSMPLRLEVQKGEVKGQDDNGANIYNYYSSYYVPFDSRLNSTVDAAFTCTVAKPGPLEVVLNSVSQLNGMGNPQFIPAGWPVVIRTASPKTSITAEDGTTITKRSDNTTAIKPHVDLYLPNGAPTVLDDASKIKLKGKYLDQNIGSDTGSGQPDYPDGTGEVNMSTHAVMVFGRPFTGKGNVNNDSIPWSNTVGAHGSLDFYAYDPAVEKPGFYTNENWWRGHMEYTTITASANFTAADVATKGQRENAHWSDARNATKAQRHNTYVYHNKVYYVYEPEVKDHASIRYIKVRFAGDTEETDDTESEEDVEPFENAAFSEDTDTPWPCDVYDLQGRRVARNETPATLRHNHPGLPKGVYIFGHLKVVIK